MTAGPALTDHGFPAGIAQIRPPAVTDDDTALAAMLVARHCGPAAFEVLDMLGLDPVIPLRSLA